MISNIFCKITEACIKAQDVIEAVQTTEHGAQNFFLGVVRKFNHGKEVKAVHYDAAISLAENELYKIAAEAQENWGKELVVCIFHRVGKLNVNECSVAIGVSAPHRDESYQASRYIIEQIKKRVPIWKKEIYTNGETEWLKGHALCQRSH